MAYLVERSLIGIKNVALTNVVQTLQFFCFCTSRVVRKKFRSKIFSAFDHPKTQEHVAMCNRMFDKCCMLCLKSRAGLTWA